MSRLLERQRRLMKITNDGVLPKATGRPTREPLSERERRRFGR